MATMTRYEVQTVCDNCGCFVSRDSVDESTFDRYAAEAADFSGPGSSFDDPPMASDNLTSEEAQFPVEAVIRHVPVCARCAESL